MCMSECVAKEVMRDSGFQKCYVEATGRFTGDCVAKKCQQSLKDCAEKRCNLDLTFP